uniref:FCP1 homology domain-containing protein n=1 Tax=Chromera velia CCMP2878 TaxID=1169474 RepID=A0A0G4I5H6_9ALVE|mmetsp:Transcript_25459/g.49759  ORF Transcript_25459/g.49759 Transcript_25459/m.49759 type:complete len:321 (-) Transcript_25459:675-1637(-)|eukprot:Cvel_11177.t1-p1 / transcript=Cvel_11177.t1 / gene=Cvel_11177 / organism=Chromera_velia_CCMP2878 / gene_product=Carboxy-terminal domain RNA polymerase II, putative / transcript_product=Carboxy-terminal domain RNA polymerase II, putative / location=Cvel_scaffold694:3019-8065(-) / protein_length=320 / sequence_SO=supercontig / SO=protein_coding / is_pseudo=false
MSNRGDAEPAGLRSLVAQVDRDGRPISTEGQPASSASSSSGRAAAAGGKGSTSPSSDQRKKGGGFLNGVLGCFRNQQQAPQQGSNRPLLVGAKEEPKPMLGPQFPRDQGKKTLVLDLDETLVHSSFRPVPNAAFVIPVEIEGTIHDIYVCKRPGVDEFLVSVAKWYECVIFTASLSKYADPLLDLLDPHKTQSWRLFREHCTYWNGNYVKDLSKLGRKLEHIIIVDNSPLAYGLQPDNAIPIKSWFDDQTDRELYDLIPILEALSMVDDVPAVLRQTLGAYDEEDQAMVDPRTAPGQPQLRAQQPSSQQKSGRSPQKSGR